MQKVFDDEKYRKLKNESKVLFDSFTAVRCPALNNDEIHFTGEGFNHLIYTKKKQRDKYDQIGRFNCLRFAPEILRKTTTIQEFQEGMIDVKVSKYGKNVIESKQIKYWAFIAIHGNRRIKVVVRKIGNGKSEFRSICPLWRTRKYGNTIIRELSTSDLEEV